jgi:hypothetical protein
LKPPWRCIGNTTIGAGWRIANVRLPYLNICSAGVSDHVSRPFANDWQDERITDLANLRAALGERGFERAWAEGLSWTAAEVSRRII